MNVPPRLARSTLPDRYTLPDRADIGIVHLGLGAFHRAHQAVFTHQAMLVEPGNWSICGASQRSDRIPRSLWPQDGLFTVTERGAAGDYSRVVGSIGRVLSAVHQPDELTAVLAAPRTHVVTLTVTEPGYRHDPRTGRLRLDDEDLDADLAGGPPRTVVGRLVRGLENRRTHGAGVTVLSCDNIPDNGQLLADLVRQFCERAGKNRTLDWINANVRFPSTVVDQIVPAPTDENRAAVYDKLGLYDDAAVVAEPYRAWVIEDNFAGPRPAWDRVGAELVDDIIPAQLRKLRIVNGSHSALAYLGGLLGHNSIFDAIYDPDLERFVRCLVLAETGRSLRRWNIEITEKDVAELLERFRNPRITHRLVQIGEHAKEKLSYRLLPPAAELLELGRCPRLICVVLAGWLCYARESVEALRALLPDEINDDGWMIAEVQTMLGRFRNEGVATTVRRVTEAEWT